MTEIYLTIDRNDDNDFRLLELPEAGEEAIGHQHLALMSAGSRLFTVRSLKTIF